MSPLLVLRPEPGASATVAAAESMGLEAVAAPLFEVRPIGPDPLRLAGEPDALLLTSANGARMLGTRGPALRQLPLYAVGEATAAAARAAGFARVTVAGPDAPATVARAAADGVARLLHLAGREHRPVAHPSVAIDRAIVYAAEPVPRLTEAARAALARGAVALLHSARAAEVLARLLDEPGLPRPRIAALAAAVGQAAGPAWPAVAVAAQPTDAALLAAAARLCEEASGEPADGR